MRAFVKVEHRARASAPKHSPIPKPNHLDCDGTTATQSTTTETLVPGSPHSGVVRFMSGTIGRAPAPRKGP